MATKYEVMAEVGRLTSEHKQALIQRVSKCATPECTNWLLQTGHNIYCSPQCKAAATRATKRKWWKKHGTVWRANKKI